MSFISISLDFFQFWLLLSPENEHPFLTNEAGAKDKLCLWTASQPGHLPPLEQQRALS